MRHHVVEVYKKGKYTRDQIFKEIYGVLPCKSFTDLPEKYVEDTIMYLESEKFVQPYDLPVLDPTKGKIKGA